EQQWHLAVDCFAGLVREYPAVWIYRREQAQSLHNLGVVYCETKRGREAQEVLTRALDLRRRLAKDQAADAEPQQNMALTLGQLAIAFAVDKENKKAVEHFRLAIDVLEKVEKQHPRLESCKQYQIRQHDNLAKLLDALGNTPDADKSRRRMEEL